MSKPEAIFLSDAHLTLVRKLLDDHMQAQANWTESALLHNEPERALRIARERNETRDVFAKINGEMLRRDDTIPR